MNHYNLHSMETETQEEKKKRVKRVFSGIQDFVHIWAHQTQDDARSRNAFFEGDTIYSYGYHFPIARIYTKVTGKGKKKTQHKVVFFTTDTYSSTTSGHVSSVRSACSHMEMLYMLHIPKSNAPEKEDYIHQKNLANWQFRINETLKKIGTARENKEYYLREARSYASEANKYMSFFGIKKALCKQVNLSIKLAFDEKWELEIDEFKKKKAEREAYNSEHWEELEEKRKKARESKYAKSIEKWRNFETRNPYSDGTSYRSRSHFQWNKESFPDLLRYYAPDDRIETSQGVKVPAESARRFYFYIKAVIARGGCVTTETCSYEIVGFTVKEITEQHICIGCHRILMTEVEAMAKQLKWTE